MDRTKKKIILSEISQTEKYKHELPFPNFIEINYFVFTGEKSN